ncbi:MAG: efflux RND transporter periplasmic adaptor subunit [Deltaproteobacteria bacterium]|nr:efflux RND transporter periplasmic adaptor subunit [Deltaproteobacteria bacterium]
MNRAPLTLIAFAMATSAACRDGEERPRESQPAAPVEGAFCSEHGVLEALCTKCNPALIPVFRAKGDFCEEHGLPLSICPVHHPERHGRPAGEVTTDDGPAEGTKVRFKTAETARLAGIRTVEAAVGPVETTVSAPARIVYDATKLALINARSAGVVRDIRADVGAQVRAGGALAVIESAAVGADASSLRAARTRVEVAQANLDRASRLRDEGISPERDVLAARRELEESRAALAAAGAALGVVGTGAGSTGRYTLTSPIAGVVVRRNATLGQLVGVEGALFEVADTSKMWAQIDIPEAELPAIAAGQRVVLSVDGLTGRRFEGELGYVAPEIDPRTRAATGRVALDNPDGLLRANAFAEATISVTGPRDALLVPRASVQRARSVTLVFVRLAEDLYEARRVRAGASHGDLVEISGNVRPGEEVVTEGSFLLKTETLRESIGAGCCDVE